MGGLAWADESASGTADITFSKPRLHSPGAPDRGSGPDFRIMPASRGPRRSIVQTPNGDRDEDRTLWRDGAGGAAHRGGGPAPRPRGDGRGARPLARAVA